MAEIPGCRELCGKLAACCRVLTLIYLTPAEQRTLEDAGATLREYSPDPDNPGHRFSLLGSEATLRFLTNPPEGSSPYMFLQDCPFLVERDGWTQCSIFGEEQRPQACDGLAIESAGCHSARDLQTHLQNPQD